MHVGRTLFDWHIYRLTDNNESDGNDGDDKTPPKNLVARTVHTLSVDARPDLYDELHVALPVCVKL